MINSGVINKFKEEGNLRRYGYTVSESPYNMSDVQRQQLLRNLINEDKISAYEIEDHLRMLIRLNSNRFDYRSAVQKWKRDLYFVEQLYDDGSVQLSVENYM